MINIKNIGKKFLCSLALSSLLQAADKEVAESPQLQSLRQLSQVNAWFAHPNFWAIAGVIDPNTALDFQENVKKFQHNGTDLLTHNMRLLDEEIKAKKFTPAIEPVAVKKLVDLSQKILLSLVAGTPNADGIYQPFTIGTLDSATIQRSLFLALSVTNDPINGSAGVFDENQDVYTGTFLSNVYDVGKFYPPINAPNTVKQYYWQLEAYGLIFNRLWVGIKAGKSTPEIIASIDKSFAVGSDFLYSARTTLTQHNVLGRFTFEQGEALRNRMQVFSDMKKTVDIAYWHAQIAELIPFNERLKHENVFKTLFNELGIWAVKHQSSDRALAIIGDAPLQDFVIPKGTAIKQIQLAFIGGKWQLKAITNDAETILWQQTVMPSENISGQLLDERGSHFFKFFVNQDTSNITAISTGYPVKIGGVGASVTVANGQALGIIESSAYSIDAEWYSHKEKSAIWIEGNNYNGAHGILSAPRNSIWVDVKKQLTLKHWVAEQRTHAGRPYNFYSQIGNGIEAGKDIILKGEEVRTDFSTLIAGKDIWFYPKDREAEEQCNLYTHGTLMRAGEILHMHWFEHWWGATETVFAGRTGNTNESGYTLDGLVPSTYRMHIEYGRFFRQSLWVTHFFDEAERNLLARGDHVCSVTSLFQETRPRILPPEIIWIYLPPPPPGKGGLWVDGKPFRW